MSDLTDVKVGDKLFVRSGHYSRSMILTADRITPSGRVITTSGEFNRNGRKRGDSGWHTTWARKATEDDIAGIYRNGLVQELSNFRAWDKLSAADLKSASEIIAKYKQPRQHRSKSTE